MRKRDIGEFRQWAQDLEINARKLYENDQVEDAIDERAAAIEVFEEQGEAVPYSLYLNMANSFRDHPFPDQEMIYAARYYYMKAEAACAEHDYAARLEVTANINLFNISYGSIEEAQQGQREAIVLARKITQAQRRGFVSKSLSKLATINKVHLPPAVLPANNRWVTAPASERAKIPNSNYLTLPALIEHVAWAGEKRDGWKPMDGEDTSETSPPLESEPVLKVAPIRLLSEADAALQS